MLEPSHVIVDANIAHQKTIKAAKPVLIAAAIHFSENQKHASKSMAYLRNQNGFQVLIVLRNRSAPIPASEGARSTLRFVSRLPAAPAIAEALTGTQSEKGRGQRFSPVNTAL